MKIRHLQQFKFMSELSNQTLYDIMYERKRVLRFKPGALVLACHPRSPLNAKGRELYDTHDPKALGWRWEPPCWSTALPSVVATRAQVLFSRISIRCDQDLTEC